MLDIGENSQRTMQKHPTVRKERTDLVILKYMAQRLYATLEQSYRGESLIPHEPSMYQGHEHHGRHHRIVIYQQWELFQKRPFTFVGFISKRKKFLLPSVVDEIQQTDQKMVTELIQIPSILSYSSLELPSDNWCNLVVLANVSAKRQIKENETHLYAVHSLSPAYYEWIRLHTGIMPQGLDHMEMHLLKTKYYTFPSDMERPFLWEQTHRGHWSI